MLEPVARAFGAAGRGGGGGPGGRTTLAFTGCCRMATARSLAFAAALPVGSGWGFGGLTTAFTVGG
jgi:hypothetical protein